MSLNSEAKKELVKKIAANFPGLGKTKRIDWQAAFAAHPEYRAQLGCTKNMQAAYSLSSTLFKSAGEKSTDGKAAKDNTAGNKIQWLTPERHAVLSRVVAEYTVNKQIKWAHAFAAHPEWRTTLDATNPKGVARLGYHANQFLKISKAMRASHSPATIPAVTAEVPQEKATAAFCPLCGFPMQLINAAMDASAKM